MAKLQLLVIWFAILSVDPIRSVASLQLKNPVDPVDISGGRNYAIPSINQEKLPRYSPLQSNEYHLFTRRNPNLSQPLLIFNNGVLESSNFDPSLRTIILIHGYEGGATSPFNLVLIPAILATYDVNVIVLDWFEGTELGVPGIIVSANSVADFVYWLRETKEGSKEDFHVIGLGVGGHYAAVTSRFAGRLGYVTALDPPAWKDEEYSIRSTDALYVETIITNFDGVAGEQYGGVEVYPNGGRNMPGCGGDSDCNHARSYFYMAESIVSGGFTGKRCASVEDALAGDCNLPDTLQMGVPFTSYTDVGIFHLETNAAPPFSKG